MGFLLVDEHGLVVNAIEYDGKAPYTPPDGLRLIQSNDPEAWIGWTYNDDTAEFTPPNDE